MPAAESPGSDSGRGAVKKLLSSHEESHSLMVDISDGCHKMTGARQARMNRSFSIVGTGYVNFR